jgi:purine-binding chemotaxis protein CheW
VLVLLFPLGLETCALPLEQVHEVVAAPVLTRLPTAPAVVAGLVNLRGDVVPVFDTGLLVGSPFREPPTHLMVVETAAGLAALVAGGLPRIVELSADTAAVVAGTPVALLDPVALLEGVTAVS